MRFLSVAFVKARMLKWKHGADGIKRKENGNWKTLEIFQIPNGANNAIAKLNLLG
jgi:hypothetical protein